MVEGWPETEVMLESMGRDLEVGGLVASSVWRSGYLLEVATACGRAKVKRVGLDEHI